MKPKINTRIANFIFAFAASLAAAGSVVSVDPAVDSKYEISGPSSVEAGTLVLLSVQGTDVKWEVFPSVSVETYGDGNAFMATAFKDVGDYLVVAAFNDKDGKVHVEKITVTVSNQAEIPEPEIVPEPETPTVVTKYPDVAPSIVEAATGVDYNKDVAVLLAKNFRDVERRISEGEFENADQVLKETGILNKEVAKVDAITTLIQLNISKKRFTREVVELAEFQDLWGQIAEGLERYVAS